MIVSLCLRRPLIACAAMLVVTAPALAQTDAGGCGAEGLEGRVLVRAGMAPPAGASHPVYEVDLHVPHRVAGEGDMMTMDHSPDRLTVIIDDRGTIVRATCG